MTSANGSGMRTERFDVKVRKRQIRRKSPKRFFTATQVFSRPRSDAAEHGVGSDSTVFATFSSFKHIIKR